MPHSFGYRARTRDMFARPFRQSGMIKMSTYLRTFKVGDYVDIKANGAVQKGMPHKFYHGRTGRVYNVTKRAVGVRVNKIVGNRIIHKHINVRIEHVHQSKCRLGFLTRVKENELKKKEARATGVRAQIKRTPGQPKAAYTLKAKGTQPITMAAQPFVDLIDLEKYKHPINTYIPQLMDRTATAFGTASRCRGRARVSRRTIRSVVGHLARPYWVYAKFRAEVAHLAFDIREGIDLATANDAEHVSLDFVFLMREEHLTDAEHKMRDLSKGA